MIVYTCYNNISHNRNSKHIKIMTHHCLQNKNIYQLVNSCSIRVINHFRMHYYTHTCYNLCDNKIILLQASWFKEKTTTQDTCLRLMSEALFVHRNLFIYFSISFFSQLFILFLIQVSMFIYFNSHFQNSHKKSWMESSIHPHHCTPV